MLRVVCYSICCRPSLSGDRTAFRTADGWNIAKAKERGVRLGQQKRLTVEQVAELQARRKERELIRELMVGYGISKATVYRYLNQEVNSAT